MACTDRSDCKSNAEIKKWLRNKFILILTNQILFDSSVKGLGSIKRESVTYWQEINTQAQVSSHY